MSFQIVFNTPRHIDIVVYRFPQVGGGGRVGSGVHDSTHFQCRLMGSFTFPDRRDQRLLVSVPKDTGKVG